MKQSDIQVLIGQLVEKGYAKIVGGEYPILSPTPKGEVALRRREVIDLKLPESLDEYALRRTQAKKEAGGTVEYTANLFANGLTPEQIAKERGLAITTIYGHLAQLISAGRLSVDQVVPVEKLDLIEAAIQQVGSIQFLAPIKELLPDDIEHNLIRCVVAQHHNRTEKKLTILFQKPSQEESRDQIQHIVELGDARSQEGIPELISSLNNPNGNARRLAASALGKIQARQAVDPLLELLKIETKPQIRQYIVKALGSIGDPRVTNVLEKIANDDQEMYYVHKSAQNALKQFASLTGNSEPPNRSKVGVTTDPIASFISASHPRPIIGSWKYGWSLGFHSRFSGGGWARSSVGDLTYRLKYEGDTSVLPALVTQTVELTQAHPELIRIDGIIPVPPSTARPTDPVQLFCTALVEKIRIPMQNILVKTRQTQPQKEMKTLAQKRANVSGAFSLHGDVRGKRLLLVDDLFDSGATLEEITRLLKKHGALTVNIFALTCTIHSDA